MTHELARTFEKTVRVGQTSAGKESDIDVRLKDVDLGERSIADARGRMTVMRERPNLITTIAHRLEPESGDVTQLAAVIGDPSVEPGGRA